MAYKEYTKRLESVARSRRKAWLKLHPVPQMVEHHVKYKEIHGIDETIWMTASEHRMLHYRLRQEGKCNIPSEKLKEISIKAYFRTPKNKKKRIENNNRYYKWLYIFTNSYSLEPNIYLKENIVFNKHTGTVFVKSNFCVYNNKFHYINKYNQYWRAE